MTNVTSRANVPTPTPGRYIAQLCKHFAHKIPATHDAPGAAATVGRIEFPDAGVCTLRVAPDSLVLELAATDEATLHRLEDVIARHLVRFAWREPPEIAWAAASADAASPDATPLTVQAQAA